MDIPRQPEIMSGPTVVPAVAGALAGFVAGTELQVYLYPAQVAASLDLEHNKSNLEHQISSDENALQLLETPPQANAQMSTPTNTTPDTTQYQALTTQIAAEKTSLASVENQLMHNGMLAQNVTFEGGGAIVGMLVLGTIAHVVRRRKYSKQIGAVVSETIPQLLEDNQ